MDTKPITDPSRNSPSTAITAPTRIVRVAMFAGSAGSNPACSSTLRADRAIALVSVVTMSTVRARIEPRGC